MKLEHDSAQYLEVEMEFRTLKKDGVLLFAAIENGGVPGHVQVLGATFQL